MNKYTAPSNAELEYAHLYVFWTDFVKTKQNKKPLINK